MTSVQLASLIRLMVLFNARHTFLFDDNKGIIFHNPPQPAMSIRSALFFGGLSKIDANFGPNLFNFRYILTISCLSINTFGSQSLDIFSWPKKRLSTLKREVFALQRASTHEKWHRAWMVPCWFFHERRRRRKNKTDFLVNVKVSFLIFFKADMFLQNK